MKATEFEQYFPVVLFIMLYNVVLTLVCWVDQNMVPVWPSKKDFPFGCCLLCSKGRFHYFGQWMESQNENIRMKLFIMLYEMFYVYSLWIKSRWATD